MFKFAGTVSHGTLRSQDLIPAFVATVDAIVADRMKHRPDPNVIPINAHMAEILAAIKRDMAQPEFYDESRETRVDDAMEWLFDTLEYLAPDGYTFGAHEGDGSDFGFWLVDTE